MEDPISHKPDCRPELRKTQIIAPVVGMRCLNCGGETEHNMECSVEASEAIKSLYAIGLDCQRCGYGLDRTLWCTTTHAITPRKLLSLAPLLDGME